MAPLVLTLGGGNLGGSGVVMALQRMSWTGGNMIGNGRTIVPGGATLSISNAAGGTLGRTLENAGTTLWAAGNINMSAAVITNRAGGLFEAQNNASLSLFIGPNRFDNAGTFRKTSSGTTTFATGVVCNNYGLVDLRSGILMANGGYSSSSDALLNCSLGGTNLGTRYAQLQVANTVILNGGLSVDLVNGFLPATNDLFTVLTGGTRSGFFNGFSYPSNQVTMQLSNSPNAVLVRVTGVVVPPPTLLVPEIVGPDVKLTWPSIAGATYRVEFKSDVNSPTWAALAGDVTAASNTASKLDPLTSSNHFYRVRVLP